MRASRLRLIRRKLATWRRGPRTWFVSHATPDAAEARRQLAALLPGAKLELFHQHDPPIAAPLATEIFDLMESCDGFIWVDSNRSRGRDWITWELDTAKRFGLPVHRFELGDDQLHAEHDDPLPFRIFVCYSRVDRDVVQPVVDGLLRRGVELFDDLTMLSPGTDLAERLERELNASVDGHGFVLLFVSDAALAAAWVREQIQTVMSRMGAEGRVVPVEVTTGAIERLGEAWPWFGEQCWPDGWIVDLTRWPTGRTVDEIMVRAYGVAYGNAGDR